MSEAIEFEALLRQALAPVEPPEVLSERLDATLSNLTELAADELESWELSAMRDPRNWARPAAAVVVGTTAGVALVAVRARQSHRRRKGQRGNVFDVIERAARDVADEARRVFDADGRGSR